MQIEAAILACAPTMLLIEHDAAFGANVATRVVRIPSR
jgi:ATPase subunit of ABC transporter with duplicated ATPase domains